MKRLFFAIVTLSLCLSAISAQGAFRILDNNENYIRVFENDTPVFTYVRGMVLADSVPEDRRRSCYVHPVYNLDGLALTDDFPKDHYHHRGLSWIWVKVKYDGKSADLWHIRGLRQVYEAASFDITHEKAVLNVKNFWKEMETGKNIVEELVTFEVYPRDHRGRIIDCTLSFDALECPVTIATSDTGYSGFNIRFAPRKDTQILTNKGLSGPNENRESYEWADLYAKYWGSDEYDGFAIIDHKDNTEHPSGWSLRHYGVLNPAFTALDGPYTIRVGEPLVLKYRLFIHKGAPDAGLIESIKKEYFRN